MRQKCVMGNWKMNGSLNDITHLLHEILEKFSYSKTECVVFPPVIYLPFVQKMLQDSVLSLGAQNVYPKDAGAFTGEISGVMLKDYGCRYVLVGHSERRRLFHEDEKFVAEKFHHVKDHDMIPVLCVGETLAEREQGLTEAIIAKQMTAIVQEGKHFFRNSVIAYEPVWAIGTGKTASPEEAQAVHAFIRGFLSKYDKDDAEKVSILYGGSVNEKNAHSLFAMPDIDGGLIGGASLHAQPFLEIVKCIN